MRNACLDAAVAELDAVGIRDYQLARGSKHLQLRWSFNGQPRMMTICGSPSDWRSPQNTARDLRRVLRQDGLLETNGSAPKPGPDPELWRQQLEELIRRLNRLNVPDQVAAERCKIAAAMRRLHQQKENGYGD
jgi:hypothetical protein